MVIIAALVGFGIFVATVLMGNKIGHRWLRYLAMVIGVVLGLYISGAIAGSIEGAQLAGQIMAGLVVAAVVVKNIVVKMKSFFPKGS